MNEDEALLGQLIDSATVLLNNVKNLLTGHEWR